MFFFSSVCSKGNNTNITFINMSNIYSISLKLATPITAPITVNDIYSKTWNVSPFSCLTKWNIMHMCFFWYRIYSVFCISKWKNIQKGLPCLPVFAFSSLGDWRFCLGWSDIWLFSKARSSLFLFERGKTRQINITTHLFSDPLKHKQFFYCTKRQF